MPKDPCTAEIDSGALWDVRDDADSERVPWAAVLSQAIHDASRPVTIRHWRSNRGQGGVDAAEQADARAFLADPERYGPVCEALGIDPSWFERQIRRERRW